jgi:vesicle coat complex subunit
LDVNLLFALVPFFFSICERITPRLAHANAAVVLSAVKVLMKLMEMLPADSDFVSTLTKKLAPPLVTLLSSEPEASYLFSEVNKLASLLTLLVFDLIK